MRSFDQIYVLDLHGNAKKKERAPDGGKDENVFDIEQGVAISLFVKRKGLEKGVWRGDLWGARLEKYKRATIASFDEKSFWQKIESGVYGNRIITSKLEKINADYSLVEIFSLTSVGSVSGHDEQKIAFSEQEIRIIKNKSSMSDLEREWGFFIEYSYRPFDTRKTFYSGFSQGFFVRPRKKFMDLFSIRENIAIICSRQSAAIGSKSFDGVFVANTITDFNFFRRGGAHLLAVWGNEHENISPISERLSTRATITSTRQKTFSVIFMRSCMRRSIG
jgi:predicted helicase